MTKIYTLKDPNTLGIKYGALNGNIKIEDIVYSYRKL